VLLHRRRRHLNRLRWPTLLALGAGVLAGHLWLAGNVMPSQLGEGAAERARQRFQVSFVHELAPAAPPPLAAEPPPPARRWARLAPAAAASAPAEPMEALADELPEALAELAPWALAAEPLPSLAEVPPLAVAVAEAASAAAVPDAASTFNAATAAAPASAPVTAQPAFDWPPSTRLSYRLTGQARGPVEGQARVEWLRSGTRYQVFLEASVGPSFAPLMSRRESSEGEITPEGLSPRRYEMEMKVFLREPRRTVIVMDAEQVHLPNGQTLPRPPGLQDAVSQFVHMTWLFTLQPELLAAGRSIELPLALPRRVEPWVYDVVGSETLYLDAGAVEAVHVRPRRSARPGDYTAEMWVAPSLQNLPVRILVRQDAETYIDLALERLPEQAERGR